MSMVAEAELFAIHPTFRIVLLCVSLLTCACSDDEPVKKAATCNCPPVESVSSPAAQYQAPGRAYQPAASGTFNAPEQMNRMPSQTFTTVPAQQEWGSQGQTTFQSEPVWGAQQAHKAPQQTYEAPRYETAQTQRNVAGKIWTFPEQAPSTAQQFQYDQRPWGPAEKPVQGYKSNSARDAARQPPNPYQWGAPTGGGNYGWGAGPYGVMPGAGYPGYAW